MTGIKVLHYDAFSTIPGKGNPAGVVLDAEQWTESARQRIAKQVGFTETVFVLPSTKADLRLQYFTPGHEMNLCGHATIAALYCLKSKGMLQDATQIHIETNVGILPIEFEQENGQIVVTMQQDKPQFTSFQGDISQLAESFGLLAEDIDTSKPIVYGSTGTWTLLIPVKSLHRFSDMVPKNLEFPNILNENSRASIHPFCFTAYDQDAFMHARHFSSPYSGTIEDPVTGTASGVMGAYYLTYIRPELQSIEFTVEQGQEMGRDGKVHVKVDREGDSMKVQISGTAVFVDEMLIDIAEG